METNVVAATRVRKCVICHVEYEELYSLGNLQCRGHTEPPENGIFPCCGMKVDSNIYSFESFYKDRFVTTERVGCVKMDHRENYLPFTPVNGLVPVDRKFVNRVTKKLDVENNITDVARVIDRIQQKQRNENAESTSDPVYDEFNVNYRRTEKPYTLARFDKERFLRLKEVMTMHRYALSRKTDPEYQQHIVTTGLQNNDDLLDYYFGLLNYQKNEDELE